MCDNLLELKVNLPAVELDTVSKLNSFDVQKQGREQDFIGFDGKVWGDFGSLENIQSNS